MLIVISVSYLKKCKITHQELLESKFIIENKEREVRNLLIILKENKTSFKHIYTTLSNYNLDFDIEADTSMKCKNIQMESIRFVFDENCMLQEVFFKDSIISNY